MGQIPPWALVHEVAIEPFLGRNAAGPVYGPPVDHRCLISDRRQLVRAEDGRETTARHAIHLAPGVEVPLESRVTVRGRPTTAVSVLVRDGGGLPTPDHVLVLCE
jgi:hypothetical protein